LPDEVAPEVLAEAVLEVAHGRELERRAFRRSSRSAALKLRGREQQVGQEREVQVVDHSLIVPAFARSKPKTLFEPFDRDLNFPSPTVTMRYFPSIQRQVASDQR
jgi:hypothetical protein